MSKAALRRNQNMLDALTRIAALEAELAEAQAALEAKHQQYTGAVIQLTEARRIIEAERHGWKIALRAILNEPQHAAIIGNPASAARAEIDEIGAALVELAEALAMGDRYQKADDAAVQLLEKAKMTLEVPAAEYVPAISDAWQLIENALEKIR